MKKLTSEDSLRIAFWVLVAIWIFSGIALLLITGKPIFAIIYLIAVGPMLTLIYHTAKIEVWRQSRKQKGNMMRFFVRGQDHASGPDDRP